MPLTALLFASILLQQGFEPGATLRLYDIGSPMMEVPELVSGQTPNLDQRIDKIDIRNGGFFGFKENFYVEILAEFKAAGKTKFRLTSDDGSILSIDGKVVVDADGVHAPSPKEGVVDLTPGWHALKLRYFEAGGGEEIRLEWEDAEVWRIVDETVLRVPANLTRVVSPGQKRIKRAGAMRPGSGMPLEKLHPGYDLVTIHPKDWNPQVGGLAVLPDGRLVVSTFKPNQSGRFEPELKDGQVWIVEGANGPAGTPIRPKLICKDLQEPLGLAVMDGKLYVSTRTGVDQLIDRDGDDVIDEVKRVGGGWIADNYHHFNFGLVPLNGWLYGALSTNIDFNARGLNGANPPYRGSVYRLNPSAYDPASPMKNLEFLTSGHRTPNGVSLGPDNQVYVGENQGAWQPSNKLNLVQVGGFYGHYNEVGTPRAGYPAGGVPGAYQDHPFTPPAIYLPQGEIANSPGTTVVIPTGEFKGQMLISDVKFGGLRRAWVEKVDGVVQGGAVQFSQGFEVGTNRLLMALDGTLYIGGIGATETWAWTDPKTGGWTTAGLQKVTPNGKSTFEISRVSATASGFKIDFNRAVPATELRNPTKFVVKQWNYVPIPDYGGDKQNRENLSVSRAVPSADRKSVLITVPGLKPDRVVYFNLDLKSDAKEDLWATEVWYTLNRIPTPNIPDATALSVPKPRVLVFSKTAGFRHDSIPTGVAAIKELGAERGWTVEATEDASVFTTANLAKFDVVVFLCTTGDVLNEAQQGAFESFIRSGGGYAGVHAASDTEYDWPWYGELVGAYFKRHPQIQQADIHVEDSAHPSTSFLPKLWQRVDEWYDFRVNPRSKVRVLANLDEKSYKGGEMGDHPVVWCHDFQGGRAWYTEFGHTKESYSELLYRRHLAEGILWASQAKRPIGSMVIDSWAWRDLKGWTRVGETLLDTAQTKLAPSAKGEGVLLNESPAGSGGHLISKADYGDAQVHVEFMLPQGGNSGIYLQGRYEVQLFDSFGKANKDLEHSDAGGIYQRWKNGAGFDGTAPAINAALRPGVWQAMDITFRAPRFQGGKKVEDAFAVEVRLNGVLVQSKVRLSGPTRSSIAESEVATGPFVLQGDHGPVAFRNVWVKPLKL
jgi:type 1 glutamine amidotransferase